MFEVTELEPGDPVRAGIAVPRTRTACGDWNSVLLFPPSDPT